MAETTFEWARSAEAGAPVAARPVTVSRAVVAAAEGTVNHQPQSESGHLAAQRVRVAMALSNGLGGKTPMGKRKTRKTRRN